MSEIITKELADLAKQINHTRGLMRAKAMDMLAYANQIGAWLLEVKNQLKHGDFEAWVEENIEAVGLGQAQKYMRLSRNWEFIEANLSQGTDLHSINDALKIASDAKTKTKTESETQLTLKAPEKEEKPDVAPEESPAPEGIIPAAIIPAPDFDGWNTDVAPQGALELFQEMWAEMTHADKKAIAVWLKKDAEKCVVCGKSFVKRSAKFEPPTSEEVQEYCEQRKNGIEPETFIDYYQARGWKLKGGQSVKDWKACLRTWERNGFGPPPGSEAAKVNGQEKREAAQAKRRKLHAERTGK